MKRRYEEAEHLSMLRALVEAAEDIEAGGGASRGGGGAGEIRAVRARHREVSPTRGSPATCSGSTRRPSSRNRRFSAPCSKASSPRSSPRGRGTPGGAPRRASF